MADFNVGDKVTVNDPDDTDVDTGTVIAVSNGPAYRVRVNPDGDGDEDDQGVYECWHVASELSAMVAPTRSSGRLAEVRSAQTTTGPLPIDVVRAVASASEFRAAASDDDGLGLLTGHFSVFGDWYRVDSKWEGTFLERMAPGAFDDTIRSERGGMKVLFDHGFDPQVGNKVLGPIRELRTDGRGAYYEVPLFDTSYNRDLLPGLKAGVYGASMRFQVDGEAWDEQPARSAHNPDGIPERTVTRASVREFGPVTFPASPGASAGVRSMTDQFYDQLRQRDSATYEAAVRAARRYPDLTGESAARSTDRGGCGTQVPTLTQRQRLDHETLKLKGIIR